MNLGMSTSTNANQSYGLVLQTMLYLNNYTDLYNSNNTLHPIYDSSVSGRSDDNQAICYGVFGCFPTDHPWTTEQRRISLHPQSPDTIRPKFPVFHKHAREIPFMLDLNHPRDVRSAGIDPTGTLYVLVHGYIDAGDRPWLRDMVHGLIDSEPDQRASVVIVDWGGGSNPPYTQAVANTRLVGVMAAHVIHMLYRELELPDLDRVHMLGHSLGAHLSGYTGYTLQRDFGLTVGRITGLDPAEPLFSDTDPLVRLDRSDANFVDVVHTDAISLAMGGLGMQDAIGHVDFYPNGGSNNPGCDMSWSDSVNRNKGSLFGGIQQFLSCNHVRSYQFMLESVHTRVQSEKERCPFMGITCSSFEDFRRGHCFRCNEDGNMCMRFGMDSWNSYRGLWSDRKIADGAEPLRVYLMTGDRNPFCRVHYKVTIVMSSSDESRLHGGEIGVVSLEVRSQLLHDHDRTRTSRERTVTRTDEEIRLIGLGAGHTGSENRTETMQFSEEARYMEPGKNYTSVIAGRDIGIPTHATLNWEYRTNPLNPLTWRILATPRIYIDHIIIESMEHNSRLRLCSMYKDPVTALSSKLFLIEYCGRS